MIISDSLNIQAVSLKDKIAFTLPIEILEDDEITISCKVNDVSIKRSAETFFQAFQLFRDALLGISVGLRCNGAAKNAHASQMMANGRKVYLLYPFHHARLEDAVDIFERCDLTVFPNTIEQDVFFNSWASLPKMKGYFFFYETKDPLSQWYRCTFEEDGITFYSSEQYMMYHKALLFNDKEVASKILSTTNQRKQKELGRLVRGFQEEVWMKKRERIVYNGNLLKFQQNPTLKDYLLDTSGKILVEASPNDSIWGIGLGLEQTESADVKNWKGLNLLGYILTSIREEMLHKGVFFAKTHSVL